MERFFILNDVNTWYDWRLILTSKDITPPTPKTNYVKIDGMSGSLDLSEALTGEVVYDDRTISATFWTCEGTREDRAKLLKDITAYLHGRKIKIIEPDDPDHYLYGRVTVKSLNNIRPYAEFSIEATCEPWRYAVNEVERAVQVANGEKIDVIIRNNGVKTIAPIISITGSIDITYNGEKTTLTDGTYKFTNLKLVRGINTIGVSGDGSATFKYREADL